MDIQILNLINQYYIIRIAFVITNIRPISVKIFNAQSYGLAERWFVTDVPMIHDKMISDECTLIQSFSEKQISYIIVLSARFVWSMIMINLSSVYDLQL